MRALRAWVCRTFGHHYQMSVGVIDSFWCGRCGEVFETRDNSHLYPELFDSDAV